jgi:hypothetical protein
MWHKIADGENVSSVLWKLMAESSEMELKIKFHGNEEHEAWLSCTSWCFIYFLRLGWESWIVPDYFRFIPTSLRHYNHFIDTTSGLWYKIEILATNPTSVMSKKLYLTKLGWNNWRKLFNFQESLKFP